MTFCLPKKETAIFIAALKSGKINPETLRRASSVDRHGVFAKILGEDLAHPVNSLFEQKLLLRDQQAGLNRWVNNLKGIPEPVHKNIVDRINGLGRVLNPIDQKQLLSDLAEDRLGMSVTAREAKELFDLSLKARDAKISLTSDIGNELKQEAYGDAIQDLKERMAEIKGTYKFDIRSLSSWGNLGINVLNVPKSILSSVDLSAPFVQGWGMMSTKHFWTGMPEMVKYFADEANYRQLNSRIIGHPDYKFAVDGKLGITSASDKLSAREEAFQSNLVENMVQHASDFVSDKTGGKAFIPNIFRASDRAFTGFLNYVRFKRFTDILNAARLAGEEVSLGSKAVRDAARVVNDFTGRGNIGPKDSLGNISPLLNAGFFSFRKQAATFQMFNPQNYATLSPTARKAALRQLSGSIIMTGSILGMAKMAGGDVNIDPRSQNFLQIRMPGSDTYYDYTGTNATYLRFIGRMVTNQKISATGKLTNFGEGFKPETRADELISYVRGKLSPTAALIADSLYGSDPVGRPFDLTDELTKQLVPMTIGSYVDMANSDNETMESVLMSLPAILGVGMKPVHYHAEAYGINAWGSPAGQDDPEVTQLNDAADEAKYSPRMPTDTINGIKLSKEQYKDYISLSGLISRQLLLPVIQSDGWPKINQPEKERTLKDYIGMSRTFASQQLQAKYPDLLQKSLAKGMAQ